MPLTSEQKLKAIQELAELGTMFEVDAISGYLVVALHPNETITRLQVFSGGGRRELEKFIIELERAAFRMKMAAFAPQSQMPEDEERH